jgi:N-methylhydantoinase B
VQHDLEHYNITPGAARSIFGAVLDADGNVDIAATEANRAKVRAERVARLNGGRKTKRIDGPVVFNATDNLDVRKNGRAPHWACAHCATDLGLLAANYKDGCLREDSAVSASNPLVGDPKRYIDDEVAFRRFFCPGCGSEIENEIAVVHEPLLRDIEIKL